MTTIDFPYSLLDSDPRLILGWRGRAPGSIEARTAPLYKNTFPELREICASAIGILSRSTGSPYHQHAHPAPDEYFFFPVDELPKRDVSDTGEADSEPHLMEIIRDVGRLEEFDLGALGDTPFLFYAITFLTKRRRVTFIRKTDPKRAIRKGIVFQQGREALKSTEKPQLILEREKVDLAIYDGMIYILNTLAFEQLFSDARMATQDVPYHVQQVVKALHGRLPMSGNSRKVLEKACQSRLDFANRIRLLPARLSSIQLNARVIETSLRMHKATHVKLLDGAHKLVLTEQNVGDFLDLVEGRWFEDDLGNELRRADKFRPR